MHLLNLVVQDGLNEEDTVIERIRASVKYIMGSLARYKKFVVLAFTKNPETKKILS